MKAFLFMMLIAGAVHAQEQAPPVVSLQTALNVQETDPQYAIELYNEVVENGLLDENRSLAAYNRGVLLMEQEDSVQAAESFRSAGRYATTSTQRRDAMFNLGHALMNQIPQDGSGMDAMSMTDAQMGMDPEKIGETITQLHEVERAFLDASRADPSHAESKKNVQRIRMQIRDLEKMKEQIEQQQQQQQQQSQDQQSDQNQQGDGQEGNQQNMAQQLQDLADQQREQAQQSESAAQQDQNQQQDQQQRSEDQQDLSEQTEQAQQQMQDAQQQSDQQEAMEDLQKAREAQREAQEAIEQGDNEKAAEKQQEAADALDRAAQKLQESQEQPEDQQGQGQSGQPQEQADAGEEPEIDEIAQQLLDKERDERERRQAYRATGRPVKVEKDW